MFCPNCGKAVKENKLFCPYCGEALSTDALNGNAESQMLAYERETAIKKSKSRKLPSKSVICLVMVPVLLIIAIFVACCVTRFGAGTADSTYLDYLGAYELQDEFTEKFYGSILISITDVNETASTGTINVTIPNLAQIYEDNKSDMQANLTTEQIQDIMEKNLTECVIEESFVCELHQDGNKWMLASTAQIDSMVVDAVDDYLKTVLADTQFTDINIDLTTGGNTMKRFVCAILAAIILMNSLSFNCLGASIDTYDESNYYVDDYYEFVYNSYKGFMEGFPWAEYLSDDNMVCYPQIVKQLETNGEFQACLSAAETLTNAGWSDLFLGSYDADDVKVQYYVTALSSLLVTMETNWTDIKSAQVEADATMT